MKTLLILGLAFCGSAVALTIPSTSTAQPGLLSSYVSLSVELDSFPNFAGMDGWDPQVMSSQANRWLHFAHRELLVRSQPILAEPFKQPWQLHGRDARHSSGGRLCVRHVYVPTVL